MYNDNKIEGAAHWVQSQMGEGEDTRNQVRPSLCSGDGQAMRQAKKNTGKTMKAHGLEPGRRQKLGVCVNLNTAFEDNFRGVHHEKPK